MRDSELPVIGETSFKDFLIYVVEARSLVEMTTGAAHFTVHVNSRMRETYEREGPAAAQQHDAGSVGALADTAKKEIANGFPMLHAHTLVGLWGALEACVDGMCEEWLRLTAEQSQTGAIERLRVSLGEFLSKSADVRWRWVLEEIKRATGSELKRGIGQFDAVLDAVGLDGPVDADVRAVLHQTKTLRNVIAHRGGRIDSRFCAEYPAPDTEIGSQVKLSSSQLVASYTAMVYFVDTVWARMKEKSGLEPHEVKLPPWVDSTSSLRSMMSRGAQAPFSLELDT